MSHLVSHPQTKDTDLAIMRAIASLLDGLPLQHVSQSELKEVVSSSYGKSYKLRSGVRGVKISDPNPDAKSNMFFTYFSMFSKVNLYFSLFLFAPCHLLFKSF